MESMFYFCAGALAMFVVFAVMGLCFEAKRNSDIEPTERVAVAKRRVK